MAGSILEAARKDAKFILSQGGFETDITLIFKEETVIFTGLAFVHHISFDTDGKPVNSKNTHITVHEDSLVGITVRKNNEVFLRGAFIEFADSSKIVKKYIVKENFADDTLGVIVLNLGLYVD